MDHSFLECKLHGSLASLVRYPCDENGAVLYPLKRRASIKDIIESIGIPHTEIGRILYRGYGISFRYIPTDDMVLDIHPFTSETFTNLPNELWPQCYDNLRFIVDVNVLKVARNLRMIGVDTEIVPDLSSIEIGRYAATQQRILVTRDRDLLKCHTVLFGQLLRSENHLEQVKEVVERFQLHSVLEPFSRCVSCNGLLEDVNKSSIDHLLEPLTRKYYTKFKRCRGCKEVYWKGSHHKQMKNRLSELGMLKT